MNKKRNGGGWLHPHEILLETELVVIVEGREGRYSVTLTRERIIMRPRPESSCISQAKAQLSILSQEIVSVRPPNKEIGKKGKRTKVKKKKGKQPVFKVVAYPSGENGGKQRKKQNFYFQLSKNARTEEVNHTSRVWIEAISEVCMGQAKDVSSQVKPPLLVLINPKAGKGGGEAAWEQVFPVLQEAGVLWEVMLTEGPGHACQIMSSLDLLQWSGVVIVSGDGLVHEVYNGLLSRIDWRTALEFSVGVIPAGSGNALSRSLIHWQGEKVEPDSGIISAAVSVARFNTIPLDLFMLRGPGMEARIGFLSLGWGLIADVDLDSEPLRWMGSLRFSIYGLLRMARRRVYRGTISYVLADWPEQKTTTIQVPIHPLDSEDSSWTNSPLVQRHQQPSTPTSPLWLNTQQPNQHQISQPPQPAYVGLGTSGYAQSWQEIDERITAVNFVNLDRRNQSEGPRPVKESPQRLLSEPPRRHLVPNSNSNSDSKGFHSNNHQRVYWSNTNIDNQINNISKDSNIINTINIQNNYEKDLHSNNINENSPDKLNGSYKTSGVKNSRQKQPVVPSSNPTSPTPTGIPPAAPAPVYPPGREPSPPPLDPVSNPITATPLHKDWVTETSDYLTVYLLNLPYLDRTMFIAPECRPGDEVLWLLIVRPSVTRLNLLKFMLTVETGDHLEIPGVDLFPVTSAKIQPDPINPASCMTVDGEKIPSGPIQVHVLPKAGRVIVK